MQYRHHCAPEKLPHETYITADQRLQNKGCIRVMSKAASVLSDGSYFLGIGTPVGHVELSSAVARTPQHIQLAPCGFCTWISDLYPLDWPSDDYSSVCCGYPLAATLFRHHPRYSSLARRLQSSTCTLRQHTTLPWRTDFYQLPPGHCISCAADHTPIHMSVSMRILALMKPYRPAAGIYHCLSVCLHCTFAQL